MSWIEALLCKLAAHLLVTPWRVGWRIKWRRQTCHLFKCFLHYGPKLKWVLKKFKVSMFISNSAPSLHSGFSIIKDKLLVFWETASDGSPRFVFGTCETALVRDIRNQFLMTTIFSLSTVHSSCSMIISVHYKPQ